MTDNEAKVVPLKRQEPSAEGWGREEQDALTLARLGALGIFEYERTRLAAAKGLGMRPAQLDRLIRGIHMRFWSGDDFRVAGAPCEFRRATGDIILAFKVAQSADEKSVLLVLADGQATVVRGYYGRENDL